MFVRGIAVASVSALGVLIAACSSGSTPAGRSALPLPPPEGGGNEATSTSGGANDPTSSNASSSSSGGGATSGSSGSSGSSGGDADAGGKPKPTSCTFDTRTFVTFGGVTWESITGYGKYWNFVGPDDAANPDNGNDLTSVDRYATGPCAGRAAGTCKFDSRAFADFGGTTWESITAYGKYWNFIGPDWAAESLNGSDLTSAERYASGPCAGRVAGTCTFDTRALVELDGTTWESITAYGKYWNFIAPDWHEAIGNGSAIDSVDRYQAGPCAGQAAGTCKFDSRTFLNVDGVMWESITAYGKYWNFIGPDWHAQADNGKDIRSVERYAAGPCN